MKAFVFFIIFILSCFSSSAQEYEMSKKEHDSISKRLNYSFELNNKSEYGRSIEITKEILSFLENTNNYNLLGMAYNSLGYSYAELKDKEKAFKYTFKARDSYIKSKDTTSIIIIYNDLGVTYEDFGMIEESNKSYEQSLKLGKAFKDDGAMVFPNYNIGSNLVEYKKLYLEALPYFKQAILYAKSAGYLENSAIYADIYSNMGYVYYKLKRYKESEKYYTKSYKIANSNKYLPSESNTINSSKFCST